MCTILMISGSLRAGSTNSAVLRTASSVAPGDVACPFYGELAELPHFNPDADMEPLPRPVVRLRAEVHRADAILICTPEYAGALPGSLKNALEWLIGDDQPRSLYQKPVAWINASSRKAVDAHASLRTVLRYANAAVLDEACAEIPVTASMIGTDGEIADEAVRDRVEQVVAAIRSVVCVDGP
jgi:NAD(P)H-dependent FMN reductase